MTTDPSADNRCPNCNSPDIGWKDEYHLGWHCRLCGSSFYRPVAIEPTNWTKNCVRCRCCGDWYDIDPRLNDGYCNDCRSELNAAL